MQVRVFWQSLNGDDDPRWQATCGLYAYVAPGGREILYIGKVDGSTVRERWTRRGHKTAFWDYLEQERGISKHAVLFGEVALEEGQRLTRQLLADIESLLIMRVGPCGNIQSSHSRISRPGLCVICQGDWPLKRQRFHDSR